MYTEKGIIYSDAGKILKGFDEFGRYRFISYSCKPKSGIRLEEVQIDISDMKIEDNLLVYSNGDIRQCNASEWDYVQWKTELIHHRYSNDDQIAIMLNKDDSAEDALRYERMQQWREWSSALAKKIVEVNGK